MMVSTGIFNNKFDSFAVDAFESSLFTGLEAKRKPKK